MLSVPCRHVVAFQPEVSFKSVSQSCRISFLMPEDFTAMKVKSLLKFCFFDSIEMIVEQRFLSNPEKKKEIKETRKTGRA